MPARGASLVSTRKLEVVSTDPCTPQTGSRGRRRPTAAVPTASLGVSPQLQGGGPAAAAPSLHVASRTVAGVTKAYAGAGWRKASRRPVTGMPPSQVLQLVQPRPRAARVEARRSVGISAGLAMSHYFRPSALPPRIRGHGPAGRGGESGKSYSELQPPFRISPSAERQRGLARAGPGLPSDAPRTPPPSPPSLSTCMPRVR